MDSGGVDSGGVDSGGADSGSMDSGGVDSGGVDSGSVDSGGADSGSMDSGGVDSGGVDSGPPDGGADAGPCLGDCLCARAEADGSTSGCEFWPTVTPTSSLAAEFNFGVVVSNGEAADATVTIFRGAAIVDSFVVAANGSHEASLPRIAQLDFSADDHSSVLLDDGAYRLISSSPVSVRQMSSLESDIAMDCAAGDPTIDGVCYALTTDGSLLLPTHLLGTEYTVIARPTSVVEAQPLVGSIPVGPPIYTTKSGFAVVVAAQATTVMIDASATVAPSADGTTVATIAAGGTASIPMARGTVLVLASEQVEACGPGSPHEDDIDALGNGVRYTYCEQGPTFDLTGTRIRADVPIQVIGGHDCALVPFDRFACDQLQTSAWPTGRLGSRYIVSRTTPFTDEPNIARVVATEPGTSTITVTPPVAGPFMLARGEVAEFEIRENVELSSSGPFAAAQYTVGGRYDGITSVGGGGDPSLVALVPASGFAAAATFGAPADFVNRVGIVAPVGATVTLDGSLVTGLTTIPGTGFQSVHVSIAPGHHVLTFDVFGRRRSIRDRGTDDLHDPARVLTRGAVDESLRLTDV